MKKTLLIIMVSVFLLLGGLLTAEDQNIGEKMKPAMGTRNMGLIFNTTNILMDLDSYQGGFGFKGSLEKYELRSMADFLFRNNPNAFAINFSFALEEHFMPGRISPYLGGILGAGFIYLKTEVDANNWTQVFTFPLSLGGLLGVEVFIFEFLSLFVEYNLAASVGLNINRTSSAGVITTDFTFDYSLDLGMGNQSKIGMVIYFKRKPQAAP